MMKITEGNFMENVGKLSKLKNVIVQAYRPDVGFLSGREDYQPYWAGRADDISKMYDCDALTMLIRPCIKSDVEISEPLLYSILESYEKTGRDSKERGVIKIHQGFKSFLDSSYPRHNINIADLANVVFPDMVGQGGYLLVYE